MEFLSQFQCLLQRWTQILRLQNDQLSREFPSIVYSLASLNGGNCLPDPLAVNWDTVTPVYICCCVFGFMRNKCQSPLLTDLTVSFLHNSCTLNAKAISPLPYLFIFNCVPSLRHILFLSCSPAANAGHKVCQLYRFRLLCGHRKSAINVDDFMCGHNAMLYVCIKIIIKLKCSRHPRHELIIASRLLIPTCVLVCLCVRCWMLE